MACEVVFARAAAVDRDLIVEYLVNTLKSPQAAGHFLDELDQVVENLSANLFAFEAVREERLASKGYRRAHVMNYLAVYSIAGETVAIMRVFHACQDYARLL